MPASRTRRRRGRRSPEPPASAPVAAARDAGAAAARPSTRPVGSRSRPRRPRSRSSSGSSRHRAAGTAADFTAQLSATALAPGARASADITRNAAGFRVVLDAHGLPPAEPAQYYQAWLKNAARNARADRDVQFERRARHALVGRLAEGLPTISVTIEAADDNQASSGRRVPSSARCNRAEALPRTLSFGASAGPTRFSVPNEPSRNSARTKTEVP